MNPSSHSFRILYADDDGDDKQWVAEACKAVDEKLTVTFVDNGREALDYLAVNAAVSLPSLIVLDLNMPELDGRQTLQRLKADPQYQNIPVAIVTTSSNKIDRDVCQRLGASLFLIKPDNHLEWREVVRRLQPLLS